MPYNRRKVKVAYSERSATQSLTLGEVNEIPGSPGTAKGRLIARATVTAKAKAKAKASDSERQEKGSRRTRE
jgi:hypothetical protein